MIAQMDRDGIFHAELRAQNLQRGRGESGAEYELSVIYRPRAGAPTERVLQRLDSAGRREGRLDERTIRAPTRRAIEFAHASTRLRRSSIQQNVSGPAELIALAGSRFDPGARNR